MSTLPDKKESQAKKLLASRFLNFNRKKKERTRERKQLDEFSDGHDEAGKQQETRIYKTPATTEEKETCASVRHTQAMQTTKTPKRERERRR
jgi:hypothetical protein